MIVRKYGRKAFQEYVDNNIKKHFSKYAARTAIRFLGLNDTPAMKAHFNTKNRAAIIATANTSNILGISFRGVYLLLLVSGVLFVVLGIRQRKIPIVSLLFWLIEVANVFAAVVGAQAEYARLVLPCMPMLMIIAAMMIDMITVKIKDDYKVQ